MKAVIS